MARLVAAEIGAVVGDAYDPKAIAGGVGFHVPSHVPDPLAAPARMVARKIDKRGGVVAARRYEYKRLGAPFWTFNVSWAPVETPG